MPTDTAPAAEEISYVDAIHHALGDAMRADESVMLMGQDIAGHGGAFKITRGYLEEFGASRVRNTPIAESGTIGIASGAALLGLRPVIEMQFADFITCGFNQTVNVAAKMFFRTGHPVPLVIRFPAGGGVGAGAFHSQNNESWFTQVPGLKVVAPAFAGDAYRLLRAAIADPNPVMYFEHKFLYRREKAVVDRGAPTPTRIEGGSQVLREGEDVTIVSYGWMTHRALEAAERLAEEGISAEVIDLPVLVPLGMDGILESVRRTSRAIVVHEATITSGFGAELAARIAEEAMDSLDAPIRRICYPDSPPPFHKGLEARRIPSVEGIVEGARALAAW
jgi:2-oxoisovalerate dehydrogenase E1 component beta subunit